MSEYRTHDEIEALKSSWITDGFWDIEDTEGFEFHRQELREWREAYEAEYRALKVARTASRARLLGFTPTQMAYFEGIEQDMEHIRRDVGMLIARARRKEGGGLKMKWYCVPPGTEPGDDLPDDIPPSN